MTTGVMRIGSLRDFRSKLHPLEQGPTRWIRLINSLELTRRYRIAIGARVPIARLHPTCSRSENQLLSVEVNCFALAMSVSLPVESPLARFARARLLYACTLFASNWMA